MQSPIPLDVLKNLEDYIDKNKGNVLSRRVSQAARLRDLMIVYNQQIFFSAQCDLGQDSHISINLLQQLIEHHIQLIKKTTISRGKSKTLVELVKGSTPWQPSSIVKGPLNGPGSASSESCTDSQDSTTSMSV